MRKKSKKHPYYHIILGWCDKSYSSQALSPILFDLILSSYFGPFMGSWIIMSYQWHYPLPQTIFIHMVSTK